MKNALWHGFVRTIQECGDDYGDAVVVTEEVNCYIVWRDTFSAGYQIIEVIHHDRFKAIERGVLLCQSLRETSMRGMEN